MAILVDKATKTREGIDISSQYLRLEPTLCIDGVCIKVEVYFYISKDSFVSGSSTFTTNRCFMLPYNSSEDGSDIFTVSHTKLKDKLADNHNKNIENDNENLFGIEESLMTFVDMD